ncbi:MAG: hypothetical protein HQK59_01790 [Deltaproteobacteria bacterium]|nr:hypothetical protein [Deltaproteobacteria bacterium]
MNGMKIAVHLEYFMKAKLVQDGSGEFTIHLLSDPVSPCKLSAPATAVFMATEDDGCEGEVCNYGR